MIKDRVYRAILYQLCMTLAVLSFAGCKGSFLSILTDATSPATSPSVSQLTILLPTGSTPPPSALNESSAVLSHQAVRLNTATESEHISAALFRFDVNEGFILDEEETTHATISMSADQKLRIMFSQNVANEIYLILCEISQNGENRTLLFSAGIDVPITQLTLDLSTKPKQARELILSATALKVGRSLRAMRKQDEILSLLPSRLVLTAMLSTLRSNSVQKNIRIEEAHMSSISDDPSHAWADLAIYKNDTTLDELSDALSQQIISTVAASLNENLLTSIDLSTLDSNEDGVPDQDAHQENHTVSGRFDELVSEFIPELRPVPQPTPSPTPEPTPSPSPSPTPTPSPSPSPTPEPTPIPNPTPVPSPEPTPTPAPEPTPEPTPDPTPDPTVDPMHLYVKAGEFGDGSQAYPFGTLAEAMEALSAGGTITLLDGIYDIANTLDIEKPMTITSLTGDHRDSDGVLRGPNTSSRCAFEVQKDVSGVSILGLEFTTFKCSAGVISFVKDSNTSSLVLENTYFHDNSGYAIYKKSNAGSGSDWTIARNTFTDFSGSSPAVIRLFDVHNTNIADNEISSAPKAGIIIEDSTNISITGNTTAQLTHSGIEIAGGAENVTLSQNTISSTNTSENRYRGGILLHGSSYEGDIEITENTITNSYNGLAFKKGQNITGKNIWVTQNLFYANERAGISHEGTGALLATHNWWGDASGPLHEDNPDGTGDVIIGDVIFDPFLTEP